MNNSFMVVVLASGVSYGTPLLYAALGELLAERSGVLNLGVEGMMLTGAVVGFWTVQNVHAKPAAALAAAILAAAAAGTLLALIHAFLSVTLRANQIVAGLALTIFAGGSGLSSYLGDTLGLGGTPAAHQFKNLKFFGLADLPVAGPIIFGQSVLVYTSWLLVAMISVYLLRTRPGLNVRAVGEAPAAADAVGVNVRAYRYLHVMAGGALAGVGGASFSLWLTPQWVGNGLLTQGSGWIAIALVIFGFWRPGLCLLGAYVFGVLAALPPNFQAREISFAPSEVFQALPFVMTIVVLVAVPKRLKDRYGSPAALGTPYVREER